MTVLERLKGIVAEMECGDWRPVSAAIFVAEDEENGILTFVQMPECDSEETKRLLSKAADAYGYARVN